jgi:curved DNA-binding protein CbpA
MIGIGIGASASFKQYRGRRPGADEVPKVTTLYEMFGVAPNADPAAIKAGFRKAAKLHHPDLNGGDRAAERRFKLLVSAYDILRQPEQRAAYDRHLEYRRTEAARAARQQRELRRRRFGRIMFNACVGACLAGLGLLIPLDLPVVGLPNLITPVATGAAQATGPSWRSAGLAGADLARADLARAGRPSGDGIWAEERADGTGGRKGDKEVIRGSYDLASVRAAAIAPGGATARPAPRDPSPTAVPSRLRAALWSAEPGDGQAGSGALAYAAPARERVPSWSRVTGHQRAISALNEAIRAGAGGASDAMIYNDRGRAWYRKGRTDLALADFDRAIRLGPELADPYLNRGIVRYRKGDLDGAIADFSQAIRIDPNLRASYQQLGLARIAKRATELAWRDHIKTRQARHKHSASLGRQPPRPSAAGPGVVVVARLFR